MNLMTLVRFLGLLVIGWTVVALGAGVLGVGAPDRAEPAFSIPSPSLHDAIVLGQSERFLQAEYRLLDRTTGRVAPLALPEEEAWSLLSVSPWRDQDGNLEVAGRWVNRVDGEEPFCGLGLLRLPGSTVVNRIPFDVLPTGKPCWVPGRRGEILFPAGDGQLYRCNIAGDAREHTAAGTRGARRRDGGNMAPPRLVTWQSKEPGSGRAYLSDPTWSSEPAFRHLVIAALNVQKRVGNRLVNLPCKLWWLVMNDDGDAIVAAGRLTEPAPDELDNDRVSERMPSVVVGAGGKLSVVYLTRRQGEPSWKLCSAKLEIDGETSLPKIQRSAGESGVLADGLAVSPLVVSADGTNVYALEDSGRCLAHSIPQ
jgi:hypothetical protein